MCAHERVFSNDHRKAALRPADGSCTVPGIELSPMRVTRCVCLGLTFDELKARAFEHGDTFETLRERTGCCTGCGACEPYVRLMLETGQTRFPVLRRHEIDAVMERARGASPSSKSG